MQWLFLSPADSHINCGCDLRETEDSRDWGHVSAQRIIQAQYKDPRIFPTRQYFISWNRLISSFLTLLQYHLQEAETPPWAQEQSLRGLRLKPFHRFQHHASRQVCVHAPWQRALRHPSQTARFPARHKTGRQMARGSKSTDQAATWQKGIQCKAKRSPSKNSRNRGIAALWTHPSGNRIKIGVIDCTGQKQ